VNCLHPSAQHRSVSRASVSAAATMAAGEVDFGASLIEQGGDGQIVLTMP
jgi:hypothetical protein